MIRQPSLFFALQIVSIQTESIGYTPLLPTIILFKIDSPRIGKWRKCYRQLSVVVAHLVSRASHIMYHFTVSPLLAAVVVLVAFQVCPTAAQTQSPYTGITNQVKLQHAIYFPKTGETSSWFDRGERKTHQKRKIFSLDLVSPS